VAVATAELVSDDALTLAWAAQAILLSVLASRLRDARLQAGGLRGRSVYRTPRRAQRRHPSIARKATNDTIPARVAPRKLRVKRKTSAVRIAAYTPGFVSGGCHTPPGRRTSLATSAPMTETGTNESHRSTGGGRDRRDSTAIGVARITKFVTAIPTITSQIVACETSPLTEHHRGGGRRRERGHDDEPALRDGNHPREDGHDQD